MLGGFILNKLYLRNNCVGPVSIDLQFFLKMGGPEHFALYQEPQRWRLNLLKVPDKNLVK